MRRGGSRGEASAVAGSNVGRRAVDLPIMVALGLSGWSAISMQVVWQRTISIELGVDMASTTVVVSAFLAGLGLGGALGGALADRIGATESRRALIMANLVVAAFGWASVPAIVATTRWAGGAQAPTVQFAVYFGLLLLPTVAQGMLLPLALRVTACDAASSAVLVGRLNAINTAGAVLGSLVAGWLLLGSVGFDGTAKFAAVVNVLAAGVVVVGGRRVAGADGPAPTGQSTRPRPWRWYGWYALVGAIALGYEQVSFRLVDSIMRSNSYSFAHVLSLYLGSWAAGAAIGARIVSRTRAPEAWFFGLLIGVGVSAAVAVVGLVRVLPAIGAKSVLVSWFSGNGFTNGFDGVTAPRDFAFLLVFALLIPAAVVAPPAVLTGAILPVAQRLVADEFEVVARRFGALTACNVVGGVAGGIATTYWAMERLGTGGTYRALGALAVGAGLVGLVRSSWPLSSALRRSALGLVIGTTLVAVAVLPSNTSLWAFLHGRDESAVLVAEDRGCGSVATLDGRAAGLTINGSTQNGYPFDDFHVVIGLLPTLVHPNPERGLVVGLGIGSTTYGMLLDNRIDSVETLELCGGNEKILRHLEGRDRPELSVVASDHRVNIRTGDGRQHLSRTSTRYDAITVDTLRPQSANSGSTYSVEFFQLVADRLADDGLFATWVPTGRALRGVAETFPFSVALPFEDYYGSVFVVASHRPIKLDPSTLAAAASRLEVGSVSTSQRRSLTSYFAQVRPACITDGRPSEPGGDVNHDLLRRDEFFLNNSDSVVDVAAVGTC